MKNNKGLVIITIILGVLVLGLGVYITYDKILKEEPNVENDNNSNTNDTINKENTSTEQNTKKSTLLDKTKIEKYKNGDGSYGTQKSFVETNYNTHLSLIGEVKVCYQSDCHKITNLNNVVDMLKWTVAGAGEAQKVLFLLDNGDLYSYAYEDYNNKNFEAKKIEGISNVDRIVEFSYSGKGKGGNWGAIAITKNNEYIEVYRESI
jgi:hypothetical protein